MTNEEIDRFMESMIEMAGQHISGQKDLNAMRMGVAVLFSERLPAAQAALDGDPKVLKMMQFCMLITTKMAQRIALLEAHGKN